MNNINTYKKPMIYTYNDITQQMKYDIKKKIINNNANGQLKLLFCELQFFLNINIHKLCLENDYINILYIGSGKGYHIPVLMSILNLNNAVWDFYDPYGHCKKLEEIVDNNVRIHNKKFLDDDVKSFVNIKNLIFISDIRTCKGQEPSIYELLDDYNLQNNFLIKLQPRYSLIKFRYPFPPELKNINFANYSYPNGIMYLQSYNKGDSAELRIFINNTDKISFIKFSMKDAKSFEMKMVWYNNIYRFNTNNDDAIAGYILNKLNIYNNVSLQEIKNKFISDIEKIKKYDLN